MGVPNTSAVISGANVNIILKADQQSGKLTKGRVKDVLTKGNHPRGIKVRLEDGQIGRVQSLGPPIGATISNSPLPFIHDAGVSTPSHGSQERSRTQPSNNVTIRPVHIQDDYRNDPVPAEERSLEDYVTIKPSKSKQKRSKRSATSTLAEQSDGGLDPQEVLQAEFPQVDSALIAAILGDSEDAAMARKTLRSIV